MRSHWLAVGIAVVVAAGICHAGAGREAGAKVEGGPEGADPVKRGDYLVNEVAHCSHCHTPADAKGQPDRSRRLQGATLGFMPKHKSEDWADKSPNLTASGLAGKWSEEEMIKFLTTGVNGEGEKPTPPMPAFHLHQEDARAVLLYLKSLPGKKGGAKEKEKDRD
jgi:mono/diheme cytochrome c family protein